MVKDRAAMDAFYKDVLGFHLYWQGGDDGYVVGGMHLYIQGFVSSVI